MALHTIKKSFSAFFYYRESRILFATILFYSLILFFFLYLMDLPSVRAVSGFFITIVIMLQAHHLGVLQGYDGPEEDAHYLPPLRTPLILALVSSLVPGWLALRYSATEGFTSLLFTLTAGIIANIGYGFWIAQKLLPSDKPPSIPPDEPDISDGG